MPGLAGDHRSPQGLCGFPYSAPCWSGWLAPGQDILFQKSHLGGLVAPEEKGEAGTKPSRPTSLPLESQKPAFVCVPVCGRDSVKNLRGEEPITGFQRPHSAQNNDFTQ